MENGKRHYCYNPVFIGSCFIYDDYKYRCYQEGEQKAPAFSNMNQHFIQVILNKKTSDDKWYDQQTDRRNDPNGSGNSGECKTDMWYQISPVKLMRKIQKQCEEIIRRSK